MAGWISIFAVPCVVFIHRAKVEKTEYNGPHGSPYLLWLQAGDAFVVMSVVNVMKSDIFHDFQLKCHRNEWKCDDFGRYVMQKKSRIGGGGPLKVAHCRCR